jgi:hypothetical protein
MSNPPKEPQASVQTMEPEHSKNNPKAAQGAPLDVKQQNKQAEHNPAEVAGQHATGSFTDKK